MVIVKKEWIISASYGKLWCKNNCCLILDNKQYDLFLVLCFYLNNYRQQLVLVNMVQNLDIFCISFDSSSGLGSDVHMNRLCYHMEVVWAVAQ